MKRLCALVISFVLLVASANAQTRVKQLQGKIVNKESGMAVSFAHVWVVTEDHEVISGFAGNFSIPEITEGKYILEINKEGYFPNLSWVEVTQDSSMDDVTIQLQPIYDSLLERSSVEYEGCYLVVDTLRTGNNLLLFAVPEYDFFALKPYSAKDPSYDYTIHKPAKEAFLWMVVIVAPLEEQIYPRNIIKAKHSMQLSLSNPWCCLVVTDDVTVPRFIQPSPEFRELQLMVHSIAGYYDSQGIPLVGLMGPE